MTDKGIIFLGISLLFLFNFIFVIEFYKVKSFTKFLERRIIQLEIDIDDMEDAK